MATYYGGIGGNDANNGTTWALRRLTLNACEDLLTADGDVLYVGPGTYRELWTIDKSGSAVGGAIVAIGDYDGSHTDGVGGVVRITGSDDDLTATRAQCITAAAARNYRTFRGFTMDLTTGALVNWTDGSNLTIDECHFSRPLPVSTACLLIAGAAQANHVVSNCFFQPATGAAANNMAIGLSHGAAVSNSGTVVSNCIFTGGRDGILITRIGGVTIKNNAFVGGMTNIGVGVPTVPAAGQTVSVVNNIFQGIYGIALYEAADAGDWIVENYNTISGCGTARTNVAVGANSITTPFLPDTRWFHEATNGGRFVTPYDMASYCKLVEVADNAPTATDMRGSSMVGAEREIGALEYDSTLEIEAGSGGGQVRVLPILGSVG